jgi:chaperonin GroEL
VLTVGMLVLSSGSTEVLGDLEDIAALTGGQVLSEATGTLIRNVQAHHFGRAQRALLTAQGVTLAGGGGTQRAVQQRIAGVRTLLKQTPRTEDSEWKRLRVRLARLTGGIGVLKLGAQSEQELDITKEQIRKALCVLEEAYNGGLVPGGGTAFLACLPALCDVRQSCQYEDEAYGVAVVEAALKAPFLQIVSNHGEIHPPLALDTVQRLGPGYGFDALHGDYACMAERHILDCFSVAQGALEAAASVSAMIMTTDTIVFTP